MVAGADMRVLVVDDEPDIRRFMTHALKAQRMVVDSAADGPAALEQLRRQAYDVLLLDVLMPGQSGLELLPQVLTLCPDLRVLMISAINDPRTRVRCLELGAVDYIAKPFVLAELIARVRIHTQLRGGAPGPPEQRHVERRQQTRRVHERRADGARQATAGEEGLFLRHPGVTLDLRGRRVHMGGLVFHLSEREVLVLACLMRRYGEVCTRQEILGEVWGLSESHNGNLVDVYVGRLRAKLPPDVISTVRNAGYAFTAA